MPNIVLALVFVASVCALSSVRADVYKYVDAKGNTYFTDSPLTGAQYRLTWKRESRRLVDENRQRLASLGLRPAARQPAADAAPTRPVDAFLPARRARFERLIDAYARLNRISPRLLHAVIRTDSAYNHEAVSHAGGQGLMQLMPGTTARYGVEQLQPGGKPARRLGLSARFTRHVWARPAARARRV